MLSGSTLASALNPLTHTLEELSLSRLCSGMARDLKILEGLTNLQTLRYCGSNSCIAQDGGSAENILDLSALKNLKELIFQDAEFRDVADVKGAKFGEDSLMSLRLPEQLKLLTLA